jgi:hypothetical protein
MARQTRRRPGGRERKGETAMGKYSLVVLSNPTEGREDEYNNWYNNQHLADVVAIPGYSSAQRYKVLIPMAGDLKHRYLATYDMDANTPAEADAAVQNLMTTQMFISDALDSAGVLAGVFESCGPGGKSPNGGTAGKCRLVVFTNAAAGRDADFNDWYDSTHIPEMVAVPGFTSGERYRFYKAMGEGAFAGPYLSIYGMTADTAEAAGGAMQAAQQSGLTMSDASDNSRSILAVYEVASPKVTASKEKALA